MLASIVDPAGTFVFIDEHPDSINDGYFLNNPDDMGWLSLPAVSSRRSLGFVADGHLECTPHDGATKPAAAPDAAGLPRAVSAGERADFDWLAERTSLER
jgi:hypothetical protein